jgi:hypothetical protein
VSYGVSRRVGFVIPLIESAPWSDACFAMLLQRVALAPRATRNHPSITDPVKVGQLLRAIDGYEGQIATHAAPRIAPYVSVRPGAPSAGKQ